jgi:endoglucanase
MQLLERLTQTPAVPGREGRLRELIMSEAGHLFDQMQVDPMGSIIAVRHPRSKQSGAKKKTSKKKAGGSSKEPTKVMLAAHMDQIGFLVKHVDDNGFLRVQNVGGFDTRNLFARLVTVCTESGDLPGVMNVSGKPIHLASEEEKKKIPEVADLMVDLGLPADEVKQKVRVGDMVVMDVPFTEVGQTVVAQALDNRVACWLVIRAIEQLEAHQCEIHCVFTVQEEVGLRGAMTSAYAVKPDIGIGVDTTLCIDTPGVSDDQAVTKQGQGAALTVMDSASIGDPEILQTFEKLGDKHNIPYQRSILPRGGTDTAGIQRAGPGVRSFTLSCPTRYIHTVTEMVHRDDLYACRDLLHRYLEQVK